jgi:hypothetical protein
MRAVIRQVERHIKGLFLVVVEDQVLKQFPSIASFCQSPSQWSHASDRAQSADSLN